MRLAIMKYGVGSWKAISSAKVLPGKTTTQIVGQVQRMMGQQSLRGISMVIGVHWSLEFLKIKLDPLLVGKDNAKKHNVSRKSGIIVNEGRMGCCLLLMAVLDNLSKEEFQALHQANKEKYALPESTVQAIVIPKLTIQETSTVSADYSLFIC